ncbi:hypothetical protein [Actinoallomurus acanthiterrae]
MIRTLTAAIAATTVATPIRGAASGTARMTLAPPRSWDPDQSQSLQAFMAATPGSESHEKPQLLSVLAGQGI